MILSVRDYSYRYQTFFYQRVYLGRLYSLRVLSSRMKKYARLAAGEARMRYPWTHGIIIHDGTQYFALQ